MRTASAGAASTRWLWVGGLLAALLALLLYALTRFGQFQGDDLLLLGQLNTNYRGLGDNLAFFSRDWALDQRGYAPLPRLLFWGEFQLFKGQAFGYHLVSAVLHSGCAALVWALAWQLTRRAALAGCAGLFFAVQPVHVPVVAQVTGQADLLATLFVLSSATLFLAARRREQSGTAGNGAAYWFSVIFYGLALLCKPVAVALPLALLAYDFVTGGYDRLSGRAGPSNRSGSAHLLGYYAPYFALLAIYLGLNYLWLGGLTAFSPAANPPTNTGIGEFLRGNLRFLADPFSLGGTDGLILIAAGLAFVGLTGVQEWEAWRLNYPEAAARTEKPVILPLNDDDDELDNPHSRPANNLQGIYEIPQNADEAAARLTRPLPQDEGLLPLARSHAPVTTWTEEELGQEKSEQVEPRPYYRALRAAGYGFLWTATFLLPFALLAPSPRPLYPASAGFALFLAAVLAPLGLSAVRQAPNQKAARALFGRGELSFWLRVIAIATVLIMFFAASVGKIDEWNRASKAYNVIVGALLNGF